MCVTSNEFGPCHIILCNYDGSLLVQCARFILLGTLFMNSNKIALWHNQVEIGSWCLPTLMRSHWYNLRSNLYVTMFQLMTTSKLKVFLWSICKKEQKNEINDTIVFMNHSTMKYTSALVSWTKNLLYIWKQYHLVH